MTSERVQRVSDSFLAKLISGEEATVKQDSVNALLDLCDARSDLQRLTAENAELEQDRTERARRCLSLILEVRQQEERAEGLEAENAELRAALATAKRDAIEEAAKQADARVAIDTRLSESGQVPKPDALLCILTGEGIAHSIRALAPDTAEGESDG